MFRLLFWLLASSFVSVQAQDSDKEVLAHFAQSNQCFLFLDNTPEADVKEGVESCFTRLANNRNKSDTYCMCTDWNNGNPYNPPGPRDYNRNGYVYTPGWCNCTTEGGLEAALDPIVLPVLQGLSELDNILCAVGLSTFEALAEMALDAIPGDIELQQGLDAAVTAAKTFAENALTPQQYFNEFISKTCHISGWDFSLPIVFGKLKGASTARGVSKGCFQRDKSICKSDVDKGSSSKNKDKGKNKDEPATTKDKDEPTTTTENEGQTTTEKKPDPTTTDANKDQCKRAADGSGCKTKHESTITKWHSDLKTITKTCYEDHWSQACYNYYSAEKNYAHIENKFTCSDSQNANVRKKKRDAVTQWQKQHFSGKKWSDFWTTNAYSFMPVGESVQVRREMGCQADEWPPLYFEPESYTQDLRAGKGQVIRWLPSSQNIAAGNLWTRFCAVNDGGKGNGRDRVHPDGADKGKPRLWKRNDKPSGPAKETSDKKGGTTTFITPYEATYTRAVFTMDFKWNGDLGEPNAVNNWHHDKNPCWPADILPDDPGFPLLLNDVWYSQNEGPGHAAPAALVHTAAYSTAPGIDLVKAAKLKQKKRQSAQPSANRKSRGDSGTERRNSQDDEAGSLQILDNGYAFNNGTISRRLTLDEVEDEIEVIGCEDATCSKEIEALSNEDADDYIVIPGKIQPEVPIANADVKPTPAASTMLTMIMPQTGAETIPDMPAPTS